MRECGGDPQASFKIRDGLGKIQRKPPIMAITLFLDRDRAKTIDSPRSAWEKLHWNPPMMAIALFSNRPRAKNRNSSPSLGKILEKPPIMATTLSWTTISPNPATTHDRLGKNSWGNRQSWRSRFSWAEIVPNPATTGIVGKNSVGSANHGHFQEQRRSNWETPGIGEDGEENPTCGCATFSPRSRTFFMD